MTAPTFTARTTPLGTPMGDGHSTKITFASNPDVSFWEKTVQPPGIDGGDAVETTTMHNVTWRTMRPRSLRTLTEASVTAAYDPNIYFHLVALVNVETTITLTFPDGSLVAFFGYLKSFEINDHEEGTQPEMDIVIQPTNWDTSGSGTEEGPAGSYVSGTA